MSACVTAWVRGTLGSCHSETKNLWQSELPPVCLRLPVNTLLSLPCQACFSQALPHPPQNTHTHTLPFCKLLCLFMCVWINQPKSFTAVSGFLKASVSGGSSGLGSPLYRPPMSQFRPPQLFSRKAHLWTICTHVEFELQLKLSQGAIHLSLCDFNCGKWHGHKGVLGITG